MVIFYVFLAANKSNEYSRTSTILPVKPFKVQTVTVFVLRCFLPPKASYDVLQSISFYVGRNVLWLSCAITIEGFVFRLGVVTVKQQLSVHTCGQSYWLL